MESWIVFHKIMLLVAKALQGPKFWTRELTFLIAIELSKKYVQKRKLRTNLLKIEIITVQRVKGSFDVIWRTT
jgi:hypothetical protein